MKKKAISATQNAMKFAQYFENRWKDMKVMYDLFWNKQDALLYPKLEEEVRNIEGMPITKVINDLDANMAMHQMMITTTGLTKALKPDALDKYMEISRLITNKKRYIRKSTRIYSGCFN